MNQVYYTTLNSKFVPTLNIIYSPGNDGRILPVTAGEKEQRNGGKTMSPNAGGAGDD